jgi:signal transduction histidine kinase
MPESWGDLVTSHGFMPHGHCYLWEPALVWLQVLANGSIAFAYITIFATLVVLVRRIDDIPFQWMYVAFAVFIVTCGVTHLFDVYVIWNPAYWMDGTVRAVTAVASVGTAILLPPLVPKAVALARAARVAHERGLELEKTNEEMGTLLDKTKELEQLKTQFFANVSHELRTPLALVLGPVEKLLEAANLTQEQQRDLSVVGRNARTLLRHVNDLLDVSKLEAGKVVPQYVESDVAQLVRLVAENFEGIADEQSIAYTVRTPDALSCQVDADKLQRVVLNLLSNAFKFTPSGGRIRCSLQEATDRSGVLLEVADSGPGVQTEEREIIFERFHQAQGGLTRKFGGTGLGLAIAKDFVELHGGTISVSNAPEGGALFTVTLPRSAPEGAAVTAAPHGEFAVPAKAVLQTVEELRPEHEPTLVGLEGDEPLVLVVEDNVEMNRFVGGALGADYRIESAFDGREGLAKARELKPDLILTDIMMPEMSGDELVAQVRNDADLDAIPIVLLTAKADDELRVRLLQEGAQDYLMKPFSMNELRARIGNLIAMKRTRDVLQRELESHTKSLEGLAREVTQRKRELETTLGSLRVAREQAERASQMKTNFLAMVSHELRTPVTTLQLQLELLRRTLDEKASAKQQEIRRRMSASAGRLVDLIDSLLHYSSLESGMLNMEIQDVDVRQVASAALDELRPRAEAKALELRLEASSDLPNLRSDARLVRLILTNLLANAIKFTSHGRVEVLLERVDYGQCIVVSDTGPGIPPEERARIFQPFQHIEPTRHKHTPGMGLGLALVRELVAGLGGSIEVESELGHGSRFIVRLPSSGPAGSSMVHAP